MKELCLGGPNNFTCAEGHIGALCESCDVRGLVTKKRYSFGISNYICEKCESYIMMIIYIASITVFMIVNMYISIKGSNEMN